MNNLKVLESLEDFVPLYVTDKGETVVYGRELHKGLGIGKVFGAWIVEMLKYGFEENADYWTFWSDSKNGNVVEYLGSPQKMSAKGYTKEYILKLEMAKEIAMIQRNEKGKQYRRYFIEVEKRYKETIQQKPQLPITYKEALIELLNQVEENERLEAEIKDKDTIIDTIIKDEGLFAVGTVGKVLKPYNSEVLGQKKIFELLRDSKILMNKIGNQLHNLPYDKYNQYFEVKLVDKGFDSYYKVYFNAKGLKWFLKKLVKEGYITESDREEVQNKFKDE